MPIPIIIEALFNGIGAIPYAITTLKTLPWLFLLFLLKWYFGGATNTSERLMHSKIVMITGGTSGIGAAVARNLAERGAQIILLTHHPPSDPFLADYIDDLRSSTGNNLIYAEQVDLASLHSIRLFATKWIDNAPPRRLDLVILCANTLTPRFGIQPPPSPTTQTQTQDDDDDGLEPTWAINYLANFHLLSILSPALRAQPPDRDVRVLFGTCTSYINGDLLTLQDSRNPLPPGKNQYATSKLATMVFAHAFQRHLDAYQRPDKQPNNTRVVLVDPGWTRTPGMRRWLTMGSLLGLVVYLLLWPLAWLVLKSPAQGAQSFLRAAMEAELGRGVGGRYVRECREVDVVRAEVRDEAVGRKLWALSEKQIEAVEKEGAVRRASLKREGEREREREREREGGKEGEGGKGGTGKVTEMEAGGAAEERSLVPEEKAGVTQSKTVDGGSSTPSGSGPGPGSRRRRKA